MAQKMKQEHFTTKFLSYLRVLPEDHNPSSSYTVIILLHGYGSHMGDLAGLAPMINNTDFVYIYPNAPLEIDLGLGRRGYAWFPPSGDSDDSSDSNISDSVTLLDATISDALDTLPVVKDKVLLGGFSQGGMMTLHYGLLRPNLFSGAISLSSKILDKTYLSTNINTQKRMPIYISHGNLDQVIPVSEGRSSKEFLLDAGYEVDYFEYTMGHEISTENIDDLRQWLNRLNCNTNK